MFWKYNSPSSVQIDALLEKEDVTLQELMEEEELLQECKVQNKKLVDFLTQPQILENLVGLVVSDPPPDKDVKVRFKHANLASELLTCDVPLIVDKVASSTNLLQMLYKFLEKEKPINPLLASFVSKVFGMLVQRRSEQNWYNYQFTCFQVLDFLKSKGEFVDMTVRHIGTSAIMDLLSKLICGVDNDDQEIKRGIHEWLNECGLIEKLIEKLSPDCDSEEHSSVDQLIHEIISTANDSTSNGSDSQANFGQSRLLCTLESEEVVNKSMDILLHEDRNESSVSHVINILLNLLSYKGSSKQSNLHHINSIDSLPGDPVENTNIALKTIINRLPELQKILIQPTKLGVLYTSYDVEVERLGSTRLQVVNLIVALVETNNLEVHSKLASLSTIQLLFDLFFKFSLNNFLHTYVTSCVTTILSQSLGTGMAPREQVVSEIDEENTPTTKEQISCPEMIQEIDGFNNNPDDIVDEKVVETDKLESIKEFSQDEIIAKKPELRQETLETDPFKHPLLRQLFVDCGLVKKILEIYTNVDKPTEKKINHNTIGYMGHIRKIANVIVEQSKEGPNSIIIGKLIEELPTDVRNEWEDFVEASLAMENLMNKVLPIQISNKQLNDTDDDSDEDSVENFIPCENLVITNQSFKEGDMESMADLRFNDNDFKETEEHLSGALQRLSGQIGAEVTTIDEAEAGSIEMFEEACSKKFSFDISTFDDIWKFKEKNIIFGSFNEQAEEEEREEANRSSSEEEGDLDDEFDALRTTEEKMDIDFGPDDWSVIFDKRKSGDAKYNPWESAPASDTADDNSWADFGASSPFSSKSRAGPLPSVSADVPALSVESPASVFSGEVSAFSTETATFSTEASAFSTEGPAFNAEAQTFGTEAPAFIAESPSFSTETPAFISESPSFSTEAPAFSAETSPSFQANFSDVFKAVASSDFQRTSEGGLRDICDVVKNVHDDGSIVNATETEMVVDDSSSDKSTNNPEKVINEVINPSSAESSDFKESIIIVNAEQQIQINKDEEEDDEESSRNESKRMEIDPILHSSIILVQETQQECSDSNTLDSNA